MSHTAPTQTAPDTRPDCPSTRRHGDADAYRHHRCRCPDARAANTRAHKQYRLARLAAGPRMVDATGTRRRIHALLAIGWPHAEIGRRLARSRAAITLMCTRTQVRPSSAERVRALYSALADTPGPSLITAGKARALGHPPPIAWDDDTIEDPGAQPWAEWPADGPDPVAVARIWERQPPDPVREVDRLAFVREAVAAGLSDREIGEHLGWSSDRVCTMRRRRGVLRRAERASA